MVQLPGSSVTVRLVKGDITSHNVDAIVNTSNEKLELRPAGVSGSILRQGRPTSNAGVLKLESSKFLK